jgi:lipid II:glycine glycyltransferase (peptidoglycan interpeptide bridge formation enzyme)
MQSSSTVHLLLIQHLEDSAWDAFVDRHPAGHILQSNGWGALKVRFGWDAERLALAAGDGSIQAGALVLFRRIGWRGAGLTLGYVPKGPLLNWQERSEGAAVLAALESACRRRGASVLKIEPDLPDTAENRALLQSYGFRPSQQSIQPRSTTVLSLEGSEEAIMQHMRQKWRYNIRLAERKGVTVRAAEPADLPAFAQLMDATGQRDGFAVHSSAYYETAYRLLAPAHAVYLLAEYQGEPLASIVVCAVGKTAWYLWGASSDKERNRMPNHALQWAGIRWAKRRGASRYDFWGIPDEIGQMAQGLKNGDGSGTPVEELPLELEALPGEGLWGVYRFKQGFGGQVVRFVGAWDRPLSEPGFSIYTQGLAARSQAGRLKRTLAETMTETIEALKQTVNPPLDRSLQAVSDPQQWRQRLAALPNPHVLQSWEWGVVKAQTGWQAERLAAGNNYAFQFLWRQPVPSLPMRIGYVPKGPVVDWEKPDLVEQALAQIVAQARRRRCLFVKIDPDVRQDSAAGQALRQRLLYHGWRFSDEQIQFKNTAYSDLSLGEEALLAGMKQKWRYNVRLAEKRSIGIRLGGAADLPAFYALYAETGQRDGFLIRPFDYYRLTWQTFLDAQAQPGNPAGGALLLAEHADEAAPVAGLFLFRYGQRAWYFYGASSERRRRDMPNYLLQWEALRWALAQGCTIYDWWGAPTELADENDGLQGVWQFKQGFGAEFQPHIGAWDYPIWPLGYDLYTRAWPKVLGVLRKLRSDQGHRGIL